MNCQACNRENREGRKFCADCGAALVVACPACSAQNEPGERFCGECAAPLVESGSAPPATPTPEPAVPDSFASGRYRVERFLGEGGKKRVYLAHDTKLDSDVALALIKTDGLDAEGRTRVRREAQAMGRLRDHPHIVSVHDIGEEDGQPYIVMEALEGGFLDDLLQEAEDHRLPLDQAIRIADQVCQALEHAHGRGVIHRDLKPSNLGLDEGGVAKLGDFGLAVALDRSRLTQAGMMVGTVAYMSPEQALGGEVTARSDLYSLGCVIYEMLCGRPPYVGDESVAIITQHLNSTPILPSWHRPDLPAGLETLILRLMEKDAGDRPASAAEVRQALSAIDLTKQPPVEAGTGDELAASTSGQDPLYRRTFVGREQELRQLQTAFDNALSGQGSLVMVVGEPGIGKTTVCEQLATHAAMRGGRTLIGHCYEEGSLSLPYLPFVEAMRSYVLERDPESLLEELGSGASEVARVVSEIRDRLEVEQSPPGDPEEERYRLLQAITGFLRNAASVQPLCIVLEDLHDADKGTLDLLTHLVRNLAGSRLMIVGTYRDVEVDRTHPLSDALAELRRRAEFVRVRLRGLSPDEVHRMLSSIANQEVPWGLAEAVHRQTEGNPLFIQEVLRYLAEEGLISRSGGRWESAGETPLPMAIPEGLRDVIGKRLSRLSDDCNTLLSVAAVIGREFGVDTLSAIAGMEEEPLLTALEEAVRVGVLEERSQVGDIRYRFAHAFFRQTLYEETIAPRRLRMHREVALALEVQHADRLEEHAAELAEHFSHSSDDEDLAKAVRYGELAARRAAGVYAHGETVRLLEQAVQVQEVLDPNDHLKRYDLLIRLAESLLPAGQPLRVPDSVAPQALEIAERLGDKQRAAQACQWALSGLGYHGAGPVFTSPEWRMWVERLDGYAAPESAERVFADGFASWTHSWLREQEPCWQLRIRALELARRLNDVDALGFAVLGFLGNGAPPQLEAERVRVAKQFAASPRGVGRPSTRAQLSVSSGWLLLGAGERSVAEGLWEELDALAERTGDPYTRAWQVIGEATRFNLSGEFERAVELGDRFAGDAAGMGIEVFGQFIGSLITTPALTALGRFDEAEAALGRGLGITAAGEPWRAILHALAGRHDEARDDLQRIMAEWAIGPEEDWTDTTSLAVLLGTAVISGEMDAAKVLSSRLGDYEEMYIPDARCTVARLLGQAALLLDTPDEARTQFTTALGVAQRVGARGEVAQVRLRLAQVLFEHFSDERAEATEHLDFALGEFRAMKMQSLLEEAMRLKMELQGISTSDIMTSIDAVAAIAQTEQPDLRPHAAPDGTVTILFSDVEGHTAINERLGDVRWMELLREHNALIREQIQSHEGYEVKTEGDGFMVAFGSARKAVHCAIAIQRAFAKRNDDASEPVLVRIGLHTGEPVKEDNDFYGTQVTRAARIGNEANGAEILVSALLKELTQSGGDIDFRDGRDVQLKDLGRQQVFAVDW